MAKKDVADYGLPPKETLILEEYRDSRAVFDKVLVIVKRILSENIEANHIYINAIEARVKAEDSLAGKLERKVGKYNSLLDLTDILGVRVITFYNDEVDKIAALVSRLFEIDWENSIDKRKMHEIHSFGYNSLHYICRLPKSLYQDPECPEINEVRFEIQMRTALQHVWSVLDHDTGYKSGFDVPREYLRNLNRLAGMLELVDEQFCAIRSGINDYRRHVESLVHSGKFDEVALDSESYGKYLDLKPFKALNKRIASINQAEILEASLTRFLSVFVHFGFTTLGDIERMIVDNSEDAYQLAAFQLASTDLDIINSSLGVISLCTVYALKQGGGVAGIEGFLEALNGKSANNKSRAENLFRVAKGLSFMKA
jgi:ppGpp synthetase/RelA/SpoT-type nucleotidyltranferase